MKIGSLFSGIGGLELGLERAGLGHVAWQVEIDPVARQVLARHWPGVKRYNDVLEVRGGEVEPVDVICGGFPCQDLSVAGRGASLEGARSGLWFEYLRIVRELRPRIVVVENVAALVTRGLDVVLGGLAEAGYDATWFVVRASDVGASHQRARLFIVGHSNGPGPQGRGVRGLGGADEWDSWEAGGAVADAACVGRGQGRPERERWEREPAPVVAGGPHDFPPGPGDHAGWRAYLERYPERAPAVRGKLGVAFVEAMMGFPEGWTDAAVRHSKGERRTKRRERLKMLGNAVVPQVAEAVGLVALGLRTRTHRP